MRSRLPPEYRALNPALYRRFPITTTPMCEHRLSASIEQSADPMLPSSKKLIFDFEESFLKVQDPKWRYWRTRRLKGFRGQYYWENGCIRFSVRSPEIPFFGLRASFLQPDIPIAYSSLSETEPTPTRFFLGGKEYLLADVDGELKARFTEIADGRGVVRPGSSLERFL